MAEVPFLKFFLAYSKNIFIFKIFKYKLKFGNFYLEKNIWENNLFTEL